MNFRSFTNDAIEHGAKEAVGKERLATTRVLHYLQELENRKLYAERGFPTLHAYCVQVLSYSTAAAYRRIAAMRLLAEMPSLEEKLNSGELNLSTLSTVQNFLVQEEKNKKKYSPEEKIQLMKAINGKSRRETDRILTAISPFAVPQERERVLTPELTEIRFVASRELLEKLDRLKNHLSHKIPNPTYAEFFEELADLAIRKMKLNEKEQIEKQSETTNIRSENTSIQSVSAKKKIRDPQGTQTSDTLNPTQSFRIPPAEKNSNSEPHLPAQSRYTRKKDRRALREESQGQCTFIDPKTGRRCESKRFLQIEHCEPYALGGSNHLSNLRILCGTHNRLLASQIFKVTQKVKTEAKPPVDLK